MDSDEEGRITVDGDGLMETGEVPDWPMDLYRVLKKAGVRHVSYVPDAGHSRLIELFLARMPAVVTNLLTTEEEGVAIAAGAWLGGQRSVLLMQSSGVGNCINMLSLATTRAFPAVDAGDDARRMGGVQSLAGADGAGDRARLGRRSACERCAPIRQRIWSRPSVGRRAGLTTPTSRSPSSSPSGCWGQAMVTADHRDSRPPRGRCAVAARPRRTARRDRARLADLRRARRRRP